MNLTVLAEVRFYLLVDDISNEVFRCRATTEGDNDEFVGVVCGYESCYIGN